MKKICMFCLKSHKAKRPAICQAKGDIMNAYLNAGLEVFQVLAGVHSGLINLENEAELLVIRRRRALKKKKK